MTSFPFNRLERVAPATFVALRSLTTTLMEETETMTQHEIEAKFECTPDGAERLATLSDLAGFALQSEQERTQTDTYFDTPNRLLRERSASLRLRYIDGGTLLATYKGPRESLDGGEGVSLVKRIEIEHPVELPDGMGAEAEPSSSTLVGTQALAEAEAAFGHLDLAPVARLRTKRRLRRFGDASGSALELALDQVEGRRLSDDRHVKFFEVELESLTGDVPILRSAVAELRAVVPGLQSSDATKLGRTLDG